ncbi:MAG: hypothetical protein VYB54_11685 [Pseudomonadota bacterium]|nr:hypothetical protein [Pseudomonadota bacterium]
MTQLQNPGLQATSVDFAGQDEILRLLLLPPPLRGVAEHVARGRVVRRDNLAGDSRHETGMDVLRAIAPEIAAHPDVFGERLVLFAFSDVGSAPDGPQDMSLLRKVADRLLDRLVRVSGRGDLLFEFAYGYALGLTGERSAEGRQRWIDECETTARTLLGDLGAGSVGTYRLAGARAGAFEFAATARTHFGAASGEDDRAARYLAELRAESATPLWTRIQNGHRRAACPVDMDIGRALDQATMHFLPIWDVPNGIVATFGIEHYSTPGSPLLHFGNAVEASGSERQKFEVALDLVEKTDRQIRSFDAHGQPGFITTRVDFGSIAARRGMSIYLAALRHLEERLRRRRMIEITFVPQGVNTAKLAAMIEAVRPFCRIVLCRVSLFDASWTNAHSARPELLGVDVSEGSATAEETARAIARFGAFCKRNRAIGYAIGLHRREAVDQAIDAGLRFLHGDAILESVTDPASRTFTVEDLRARRPQ